MQLNQYYTEQTYGDALVKSLSLSSPKIALDLGFGAGNLLHAAKRRWKNLNLVGIDIDKSNVHDAKSKSFIDALTLNGFEPCLPNIIEDRFGEIDLLVSNPPYFSCELDRSNKEILKSIGLLECLSNNVKKIPAELIFLAQNLRLLSQSGELGIIVPAGLISGEKWKPIREFLFSSYCVSNVVQLPTNSFKQTDAQTFILTLKHKNSIEHSIPLSHINESETFNISKKNAIERSDYNYYKECSGFDASIELTANDFSLYRGNISHGDLACLSSEHLHTTAMPDLPVTKGFDFMPFEGGKNTNAGDILIARVGRRCLGRTMYIESGNIPISDCIIGVRPKSDELGEKIWKKLSSPQCREYLENVSLGVGAKYITYKTITDYLVNKKYATT